MMEDIFTIKELSETNEGDVATKPNDTSDEDCKKMNKKTITYIKQWVDVTVFNHISQETSAHAIRNKLESMYEQKSTANKLYLIHKLVNLKFMDNRNVAEHLNEFQSVMNRNEARL
ncbi:hypothetical protein LWI29_009443 [Acer saccharum]|uniref:Polyprotein n=1 Tax=Acer saccharum TaxID=4024 RepID=A0AA39SDJ1_ACESA|nr:hypothetical protein LWI29_009443 [Acer saccharum]